MATFYHTGRRRDQNLARLVKRLFKGGKTLHDGGQHRKLEKRGYRLKATG
jgi:hypothetical protein